MSESASYAPVPGRVPGTMLNLGGHELVLAPLTLPLLQRFAATIQSLDSGKSFDATVDGALPLIHASLARNYPEITLDEVRALLDMGNIMPAIAAITGGLGVLR